MRMRSDEQISHLPGLSPTPAATTRQHRMAADDRISPPTGLRWFDRRGPRLLAAAAVLAVVTGIWLWRDLVRDLPDRRAISNIGATAQSTMVFDGSDRDRKSVV